MKIKVDWQTIERLDRWDHNAYITAVDIFPQMGMTIIDLSDGTTVRMYPNDTRLVWRFLPKNQKVGRQLMPDDVILYRDEYVTIESIFQVRHSTDVRKAIVIDPRDNPKVAYIELDDVYLVKGNGNEC